MKLERLNEAEHDAWDRFVESCPAGHLFLTAWWHRLWDCVPEVRVVRDGAGRICAGAASWRGTFMGRAGIRRPPFTPYNHPLVDEAALPRASQQLEVVELLLADLLRLPTVDFVFRFGVPLVALPYMRAGFENRLGISYVIDASSRSSWKTRLSASHRRYLRRAEEQLLAAGWKIERPAGAEECWPLFEATGTHKKFRLASGRDGFVSALGGLTERGAGEAWALRDPEGVLRAATLLVRDRAFAYYLGGGLRVADRRDFRGNYLLFEAMIRDALERGLGFDFEGSSIPGVERFFRGWGGDVRYVVRQIRLASFLQSLLWSARWSLQRRARSPARAGET